MVKKNNRSDGDVKSFQKIIGIASLLKNEPSTSHRSENWPSLKSMLLQCWSNLACIHSTTSSKFQNHQSNSNNPQSKASSPVGSLSPQLLYPQRRDPLQSASTSQSPSPAEQGSSGLKIEKFKSKVDNCKQGSSGLQIEKFRSKSTMEWHKWFPHRAMTIQVVWEDRSQHPHHCCSVCQSIKPAKSKYTLGPNRRLKGAV